MRYSKRFRRKMVQKMLGPRAKTASGLSEEVGICQSTLSRWKRSATIADMSEDKLEEMKPRKRPQDWTAEEKLEAVREAGGLEDEELGAYLRRSGLHEAQLKKWRAAALEGLSKKKRSKGMAPSRRIRELERELRRKEKALAEAAALLILKKKAEVLWGDGDDDTDHRSGKTL